MDLSLEENGPRAEGEDDAKGPSREWRMQDSACNSPIRDSHSFMGDAGDGAGRPSTRNASSPSPYPNGFINTLTVTVDLPSGGIVSELGGAGGRGLQGKTRADARTGGLGTRNFSSSFKRLLVPPSLQMGGDQGLASAGGKKQSLAPPQQEGGSSKRLRGIEGGGTRHSPQGKYTGPKTPGIERSGSGRARGPRRLSNEAEPEPALVSRRSEYGQFLARRFLKTTRFPAGLMDTIRAKTRSLLCRSPEAGFATSTATLLVLKRFHALLLVAAALHLARFGMAVNSLCCGFSREGDMFRFTHLEGSPLPASIALTLDGCDVAASPSSKWDGGVVVLSFEEPVGVNGWRFEGGGGGSFRLDRRLRGGEWVPMGGTRWTWVDGAGADVMPGAPPFDPPGGGGGDGEVEFDLRAHWTWAVELAAIPLLVGLLLLVSLALAWGVQAEESLWLVKAAIALPLPLRAACLAERLRLGDQDAPLTASVAAHLAVGGLVAATGLLRRRFVLWAMAVGGLAVVVTDVAMQGGHFAGRGGWEMRARWAWADGLLLALPLAMTIARRLLKIRAVSMLVHEDTAAHNAIWEEVISRERKEIYALGVLCRGWDQRPAQQFNRVRAPDDEPPPHGAADGLRLFDSILRKACGKSIPGVLDPANPVQSLDQLFAHAAGVDSFLRSKVKVWAQPGQGLFRMKDGQWLPWTSISLGKLDASVAWPRCKSPHRAISKAFFCYRGRVSRLVDLCRQRIAFASVKALRKTLTAVMSDPEVVIERVKNSMDLKSDVVAGGLRQVVVNLRIDDPVTRWLGIETHVCELVLCLREFADQVLETPMAHQRYRVLRDNRVHRFQDSDRNPFSPLWQRFFGPDNLHGVHPGSADRGDKAASEVDDDSDEQHSSGEDCSNSNVASTIATTNLHRGRSNETGEDNASEVVPHSGSRRPSSELQAENPLIKSLRRWSFVGGNSFKGGKLRRLSSNAAYPGILRLPSAKMFDGQLHQTMDQGEQVAKEAELWQGFFVSAYLTTTLGAGDFLGKQLQRESAAMAMANSGSALYVSKPVSAAMTTSWFRRVLMLVALGHLIAIIFDVIHFEGLRYHEARCVRLSERGEGAIGGWDSRLQGGLTVDGCRLDNLDASEVFTDGLQMTLCFPQTVVYNGWYVDVASTGATEGGKGEGLWYVLEAQSGDGESEWTLKGSSGARFASWGRWVWSVDNGHRHRDGPWKLGVPWQFHVGNISRDVVFILGPCVSLACVHMNRIRLVHSILAVCFLIASFTSLTSAVSYYTEYNTHEESFSSWCDGATFLVTAVVLQLDAFIVPTIFGLGMWQVLANLIENYVIFGRRSELVDELPVGGIALLVLWIVIVVRRQRALRWAAQMIEPDARQYDDVWQGLLAQEGFMDALQEIKGYSRTVSVKEDRFAWELRQCNRTDVDEAAILPRVDTNCASGDSLSRRKDFHRAASGSHYSIRRFSTEQSVSRTTSAVSGPPASLSGPPASFLVGGEAQGSPSISSLPRVPSTGSSAHFPPSRSSNNSYKQLPLTTGSGSVRSEEAGAHSSASSSSPIYLPGSADSRRGGGSFKQLRLATAGSFRSLYTNFQADDVSPERSVESVSSFTHKDTSVSASMPGRRRLSALPLTSSTKLSALPLKPARRMSALPLSPAQMRSVHKLQKGLSQPVIQLHHDTLQELMKAESEMVEPPYANIHHDSMLDPTEGSASASAKWDRESTRAKQLMIRKMLLRNHMQHGGTMLSTIDSAKGSKGSRDSAKGSKGSSGDKGRKMMTFDFGDSIIEEEETTLPANFARATGAMGKRMLSQEIKQAKDMDELEGKLKMSAMTLHDQSNIQVLDGEIGNVDWTSPVRSLDQLFAQAAGLDIILKAMVQKWALASDGLFPTKNSSKEYVSWKEAVNDMALARSIKWGKLKSPDRAIEKAFRSYRGDVSHVLDLARQTIVFQSVHSLVECLRVIHGDSQVVVERVKNRMDPDWASQLSAGYRDVSLNLRIQNKVTQGMGIETHVCEVQLLLTQFADLKNDTGHSRYVAWRNTRGE